MTNEDSEPPSSGRRLACLASRRHRRQRKDTTLLRAAYERASVREYWLIDARGHDVAFDILLNQEGVLCTPEDRFGPQVSDVLEGRWTLTRSTNRAGRFAYRLTHENLGSR